MAKGKVGGLDITAIPRNALKVLLAPQLFFREMPKKGGFVEPLIFVVAIGLVNGAIYAVASLIGITFSSRLAGIGAVIWMPIGMAIGSFIGGGILFLMWKALGSREDYETAYRCGAYISTISPISTLFGLIPYVGGLVGVALGTLLCIVASIETHKIDKKKATTVFAAIGAVLVLISVGSQIAARRIQKEGFQLQQKFEEASKDAQKKADELKKEMEKYRHK